MLIALIIKWRNFICFWNSSILRRTCRYRSGTLRRRLLRIRLSGKSMVSASMKRISDSGTLIFSLFSHAQVTYYCAPGFDLVGRANRYCQADGTWTPSELPICVRKFLFTCISIKRELSTRWPYWSISTRIDHSSFAIFISTHDLRMSEQRIIRLTDYLLFLVMSELLFIYVKLISQLLWNIFNDQLNIYFKCILQRCSVRSRPILI